MELIQLENLQLGNFNIYVQSIKCARRQLFKLWPSSPFCCEDDMLVMISTWIDKGWSRLWRFILLQGLCGSKAQAGIIFMKKPPQFPASHLSNFETSMATQKAWYEFRWICKDLGFIKVYQHFKFKSHLHYSRYQYIDINGLSISLCRDI